MFLKNNENDSKFKTSPIPMFGRLILKFLH